MNSNQTAQQDRRGNSQLRQSSDEVTSPSNVSSGRQRQKQTGAVQAFKIASEAQSYLEGGNLGEYVNKKPNLSSYTTGGKGKSSVTPGAANNVIKNRISGEPRTGINQKPASRIKVNKSPLNAGATTSSNGTTGQKAESNILATSVLTVAQQSQLSQYQSNQRNTPNIFQLSHNTVGSSGTPGINHESQVLADVVVAADGTTTVGHYKLGRDLGKGTFGKVKVGTHTLTGEKVAIKVLEKDKIIDVNDVDRVAREIKILKIVRHPVVVQLYEIVETKNELYLIMEYARGGELFEYIVNRKRVREKEAAKFLLQLISGIEYLHKLGICHRDLKPENLLMDDYNNIKIVDFGLSNTYKSGQTLKTACGSPCYAAPEMVAGKHYHGLPADVWSCGVILYAMVCGYLPFEDPKTNVLYKKILNADYSIPDFVSEDCRQLITKILNTDPTKRYTASDIRQHVWFKQVRKVKDYPGIIIGKNPIPVDSEQLQIVLDKYLFDQNVKENAKRLIEANKHNPLTTCYYLTLKRFIRSGGKSIADITKYDQEKIQEQIQNEMIKHQMSQFEQSEEAAKQSLVMSFEVPPAAANQTASEEKAQKPGIFIQVSGQTNAALNKLKSSEGPPTELTSKFTPESSCVGFDGKDKNGIVTMTRVNGGKKTSQTDTSVLSVQNMQRKSVASSDNKPALTKQKQKIITSQDNRTKIFATKNGPNVLKSDQKGELFQRQFEQPPRNQTSCNNRSNIHKQQQQHKQVEGASSGFGSVILNQGERKSQAVSQLARNSNFGSTNGDNNYSGLVMHSAQHSGTQIVSEQNIQKQYRFPNNAITSDSDLIHQQKISFHANLAQSPSPHTYFKNKQAQKNLLMNSQAAATSSASNNNTSIANETFELAQRQIQNQRKLMQMTQSQFQRMENPPVGQASSEPQQIRLQNYATRGNSQTQPSSQMKLIPSKLTRKQILANALANQQQLPPMNPGNSNSVQRRKPKTSGQFHPGVYQQAQNQANTSSSSIPQSQLIFQGVVPQNFQMSPTNNANNQQSNQHNSNNNNNNNNSDMQYMYFTPRDMINFHSTTANLGGQAATKTQPVNINFGTNMQGPLFISSNPSGQGGAQNANQASTTQANYFKNVVRLSQNAIQHQPASTSHQTKRPLINSQNGKINFKGSSAAQGGHHYISRQQQNQSPSGARNSSQQTHQLIQQSLPPSVKANNSGTSTSSMLRRRTQMPQSVVQNTNSVLDWSNISTNNIGKQRTGTRGSSVTGTNQLNQTHLNLSNYKKSNLTSSKLGGIQSILNKVSNTAASKVASGSSADNHTVSRSMNVQDILNKSQMDSRGGGIKANLINQSQDMPNRLALEDATRRPQIEKFRMNNNFISDVNQSFVLQGGPQSHNHHQGKTSTSQTSKQAALKKKHFQFQQNQFEMLNQTQPLQGGAAQYSLPLSSYDLTQINLNSAGNVVTSPQQQNPTTAVGGVGGMPQQQSNSGTTAGGNYRGGGKFKVHIEFQPN